MSPLSRGDDFFAKIYRIDTSKRRQIRKLIENFSHNSVVNEFNLGEKINEFTVKVSMKIALEFLICQRYILFT